MRSYYEASARERIIALLDPGTFHEFLPPQDRVVSPHLKQLDTPAAFDDGVIVWQRPSCWTASFDCWRRKADSWAARSGRCTAPN